MKKIAIDGDWKLYYYQQKKYCIESPGQLEKLGIPCVDAQVPGNVELDLSRAGVLPEDLFFGDNIRGIWKYEDYMWWYVLEFDTPQDLNGKNTEIRFNGADCLAEYWLNGTVIGRSENMFIEHSFPVDGVLKPFGTNVLAVALRSTLVESATKHYSAYMGLSWGERSAENLWIRKAPHTGGWDIMPRALSAGLWRPVELVVWSEHEILDFYQFTLDVSGDSAEIGMFVRIGADFEHIYDMELSITGRCGDSVFSVRQKSVSIAFPVKTRIKDPKLWWPRGYGEQNLYDVSIQLTLSGEVLAERRERIGIRKAELIRTDTTTIEEPGEFLFKINNEPIFCKGSNWVPADAFHSRDAGRYEQMMALVADTNCNILRCWGGNVYEDHAFFDLCDEYGVMVWQDFAMACALYPQSADFQEILRAEGESVIRKLRNHPSIVLWSGDNENDMCIIHNSLDPNDNVLTRVVLPEVVRAEDPYRPYLPSSPYFSPAVVKQITKPDQWYGIPEQHLWGPRDYYKSKFYTGNIAHFVSEIGYHGCPNLSSVVKFIDKDHLWPWEDNAQWITHATADGFKRDWNSYRIPLMANQVRELFGECPDNLEDFILASQISQAEAKKFFLEMTRIKKWRKTGVIWWNIIDGWPQFSDAVVDYYFGKKLAYYYLRRAQADFTVIVDEPEDWHVNVFACNDTLKIAEGRYEIWDADTGEILLDGEFRAKANENTMLGRIPVFASEQRLFLIRWETGAGAGGSHYLLGVPAFSLERYKGWLKHIAAVMDDFNAESIGK